MNPNTLSNDMENSLWGSPISLDIGGFFQTGWISKTLENTEHLGSFGSLDFSLATKSVFLLATLASIGFNSKFQF